MLGTAILPIPAEIMLDSLKEVINKTPPGAGTTVIEDKLKQTLFAVPFKHVEIRVSRRGRDIYILYIS